MRLQATIGALAIVTAAGCGVSRHYANNTVKQLQFRTVDISYSMSPEVTLTSSDHRSWRGYNNLSIQYPHPSPSLGNLYAFVTLSRIDGDDEGWQDSIAQVGTIIATDDQDSQLPSLPPLQTRITREQLEFLLEDLIADGYFDRGERTGAVQLDVSLGDRDATKSWDRVKAFEDLVSSFDRNSVIQTEAYQTEEGAATLIPDVIEPDRGFERDHSPRHDDAGMPDQKRYF